MSNILSWKVVSCSSPFGTLACQSPGGEEILLNVWQHCTSILCSSFFSENVASNVIALITVKRIAHSLVSHGGIVAADQVGLNTTKLLGLHGGFTTVWTPTGASALLLGSTFNRRCVKGSYMSPLYFKPRRARVDATVMSKTLATSYLIYPFFSGFWPQGPYNTFFLFFWL